MRRILRSTLPMVASLAFAVGALGGVGLIVGHVRSSQDSAYCRKVTPTIMIIKGVQEPVPAQQLVTNRAGCVAQRRRQRGLLGAVWRTGGQEMAACGIDWGRYQQLTDTDPAGADAVLKPYGLTGTLDGGSRDDEHRFITVCVARQHGK